MIGFHKLFLYLQTVSSVYNPSNSTDKIRLHKKFSTNNNVGCFACSIIHVINKQLRWHSFLGRNILISNHMLTIYSFILR